MENIVYIKKVDNYDEILKGRYKNISVFWKKIIFMYKNMFNIITKKKIEDKNIWIVPIQDKYSENKMNNIIKKMSLCEKNIYVLPESLLHGELLRIMDRFNISYITGKEIKRYLVIKILKYINDIKSEKLINNEITILATDNSEFNINIIEKLSKLVKYIKIVSPNIYKFKKIEEKLYNEYGIGIQFSNSYKKSLVKSKIIVNLDYNKIDINEYEIYDKAILINISKEEIKIKNKLFNGIVINSCNINFKKELREKFIKINLYHGFNNLLLYESIISKEMNIEKVYNKIEEDKIVILNVIGNNGIISRDEFKNIFKRLDK